MSDLATTPEQFNELYSSLIALNDVDTKSLDSYGLQLYWMAQGIASLTGTLKRSWGLDEKYMHVIRNEANSCAEELFKYIKR